MNALILTLILVVCMGAYLLVYGFVFLRRTGKLMGAGWMIIGLFLGHLAWWSFKDYRDAIGERVDRMALSE